MIFSSSWGFFQPEEEVQRIQKQLLAVLRQTQLHKLISFFFMQPSSLPPLSSSSAPSCARLSSLYCQSGVTMPENERASLRVWACGCVFIPATKVNDCERSHPGTTEPGTIWPWLMRKVGFGLFSWCTYSQMCFRYVKRTTTRVKLWSYFSTSVDSYRFARGQQTQTWRWPSYNNNRNSIVCCVKLNNNKKKKKKWCPSLSQSHNAVCTVTFQCLVTLRCSTDDHVGVYVDLRRLRWLHIMGPMWPRSYGNQKLALIVPLWRFSILCTSLAS